MNTAAGAGLLTSAVRRDIMDSLANLPLVANDPTSATRRDGLSAAELGERLGLHVTTVRFHLNQLLRGGLVTSHSLRREGAGRPRTLYRVNPGSLAELADSDSFRQLAGLLAESFAPDADGRRRSPEEAGEKWAHDHAAAATRSGHTPPTPARSPGSWLAKIGALIDVLEEWGYTPDLQTADSGRTVTIDLVDCPFLSLAADHPAVVCGVHRGLLRGTLDVLGERTAHVSLEPFVQPTLCRAHITTEEAGFTPRGGKR